MIYAEKREMDSGSIFYLVYNDDMIGSYRIDMRADGTVSDIASRDYHKLATPKDIKQYRAYEAWRDNDYEGEYPPHYGGTLNESCIWHNDKPCLCDGSYNVEVTTDDKRCFMIAAMMANLEGRCADLSA
jgi:hypothetical protein